MKKTQKISEEALKRFLRSKGLKATSDRVTLLAILKKSIKPLTIEALHTKCVSTINRATLYRNMAAMSQRDIVRKIEFRHGHAHYEFRQQEDHHHVVCVKCDRIEDVQDCSVSELIPKLSQKTNFFIQEHSLEFFGVCSSCKKI
ncbi:transcriptional repressor [Candidatus Uhrbacteria bacterium]|nr:transcriptional repressor [Candidatus Uhrbacteria bacterium]